MFWYQKQMQKVLTTSELVKEEGGRFTATEKSFYHEISTLVDSISDIVENNDSLQSHYTTILSQTQDLHNAYEMLGVSDLL